MLETGYIKLHRSILKWEWYDDVNTSRLFLHLLLTVNHYDASWHGITIPRGSRVSSYAKLAKETSMSVRNIRTSLNHLKSTGEVTHLTTPEYGLFTVVNYDKYQDAAVEATGGRQSSDSQATVDRQQSKNDKNDKNDKKSIRTSEIPTADCEKAEILSGHTDYKAIVESFNSICTSLPKVRDISDKRKRAVNAASKLVGDRFDELFRKVEASDFLSGRVKEWRSNFDWILKPVNVTKILEGTYDNRSAKKIKTKAASFDLDEYAQTVSSFVPIYKK